MKEKAQLDLRKISELLLSLLRLFNCLYQSREVLILFLSRFWDASMTFSGILEVGGKEGQ